MGRTTTPKFELQIERKDGTVTICGVNSIKEANEEIKLWFDSEKHGGDFFLWGNNKAGHQYFRKHSAFYARRSINTPWQLKKFGF